MREYQTDVEKTLGRIFTAKIVFSKFNSVIDWENHLNFQRYCPLEFIVRYGSSDSFEDDDYFDRRF